MHRELGLWRWLLLALLWTYFGLGQGLRSEAQTSILVGTIAEQRADARILKALSTPVTIQSFQRPLGIVLAQLSQQAGVSIILDRQALEAINIKAESEVTLNLRGITARNALQLACRSLDPTLTWAIMNEGVLVTTKEESQNLCVTRIYPVGDLIETEDESGADYDPLLDVICRVIEPASWDSEGGMGSIFPLPSAQALICTQTREVHEEVRRLIEILREIRDPDSALAAAKATVAAAEESADERMPEVDVGTLLGVAARAPKIDRHPAPWRVPQRYDN